MLVKIWDMSDTTIQVSKMVKFSVYKTIVFVNKHNIQNLGDKVCEMWEKSF